MENIKFNKDIYNLKSIEKAIVEFKNLANFKVKDAAGYYDVSFNNVDEDVQGVIKDEFANYVLGLMS